MPIAQTTTVAPATKPIIGSPIETVAVYSSGAQIKTTTEISGTPATTNFFFQLLLEDDVPKQLDITLDRTQQQYLRVNNNIIMLQGDMSYSEDSTSGIVTWQGTAHLYPGRKPNVGDHFVMKLADGRDGLFVVTRSESFNIYTYSAYEIDFKLFQLLNDSITEELIARTVQTLKFEAALAGCPSAIGADEATITEMAKMLGRLVKWYYDDFFDLTTRTFLYPDTNNRKYDPWLAEFWRKMVDRQLRDGLPVPTLYDIPTGKQKKKVHTIWDMLIDKEPYYFPRIGKRFNVQATSSFHALYSFSSILVSHISQVIMIEGDTTLLASGLTCQEEDYYAVSKAFYDKDTENMSLIEKLIYYVITDVAISYTDIRAIYEAMLEEEPVKLFYHIPMLIFLVRYKLSEKANGISV